MKKICLSLLAFLLSNSFLFAQTSRDQYLFTVDLVHASDDQIQVELITPKFSEGPAIYHLPKMVPGTYKVYDFGRFVSDMKAFDEKGQELTVKHDDVNTWVFPDAGRLAKISYRVDDSFDEETADDELFVFEPAGTNFEEGKNFVINNFGVFGFFEGKSRADFNLNFQLPEGFGGASALSHESTEGSVDKWHASSYFELSDAPIMFCKPDTAHISVGGADVLIAVYSPGETVTSAYVKNEISEILNAQKEYLGGRLPISHYAFIIYLFDGWTASGSYGALEHNFCSMYVLPEMSEDYMGQTIRDICAHEFFHIITPLSIHSKEIHDFDFMNPKMSKHLWLYEGVTEYSASHVQVKQGLINLETYLSVIADKVDGASAYVDTLPFTEMSKGCLDEWIDQYNNVYEKGALIGMCLDILLRKESDGKMGVQELLKALSREYGQEKPFDDDSLFAKIESLTYPSVGQFLRRYVGGPEPLPLEEYLSWVGIEYQQVVTSRDISSGGFEFDVNDKGEVFVYSDYDADAFGKSLGLKEGDIVLRWGTRELNEKNYNMQIFFWMMTAKEGKTLEVEIIRKENPRKKKGKKMILTAPIVAVASESIDYIKPVKNPTAEQMKLRKQWLGDYKEN